MLKCRRLAALLVAMVMVVGLMIPAYADPATYTLTITSPTKGHNYQVYQVFGGTLAKDPNTEEDTLVDITWGTGVQGTALMSALKTAQFTDPNQVGQKYTPFANAKTAQDVADILITWSDDATQLDEFAEVVGAHLSQTYTEPSDGDVEQGENAPYMTTIRGLNAGYYLVKEGKLDAGTEEGNTYTKFILQLLGHQTIEAKADTVPTIDKTVKDEGDANEDVNTASVGDRITFQLTSKVPAMDGYDKYFFIVHDTLSAGLTYNNITSITVGGKTLSAETGYTVTTDPGVPAEGQPTDLKIVFKNFIQYKTAEYIGKPIVIEYTATVNKFADMGNVPNTNTAKVEYSNDPNYDYQGENEPSGNDPIGETPSSKTETFVGAIQIRKVDSEGKALTGAEFTLTGTGVKQVLVTTNDFEPNESGEYYKLKDGTFTKVPPTEGDSEDYVDDTKYALTVNKTWKGTGEIETTVVGAVGEDGYVYFNGLGAGTYTIRETKVPENYNKIGDIVVQLSYVPAVEDASGYWTARYTIGGGQSQTATADENGTIWFKVENRSGAVLPSTGGMGTTLFVGGGLVLMLVAVTLLIVHKRAARNEK